MTDKDALNEINMTIKSCVLFLNEIGRMRIKLKELQDSIETLEWHRENYKRHIQLVNKALGDYCDHFEERYQSNDRLKNEIEQSYNALSRQDSPQINTNWFVPPPFKSHEVSKLHISFRYSPVIAAMKQKCSLASGRTKFIYYYRPYWSLRSAIRKLNSLQPEIDYWRGAQIELTENVHSIQNLVFQLQIEVNHFKTLTDDENYLFCSLAEYKRYAAKVRNMLFTSNNGVQIEGSSKNHFADNNAQTDSVICGSIGPFEPSDLLLSKTLLHSKSNMSSLSTFSPIDYDTRASVAREVVDVQHHPEPMSRKGSVVSAFAKYKTMFSDSEELMPTRERLDVLLRSDELSVFEPFNPNINSSTDEAHKNLALKNILETDILDMSSTSIMPSSSSKEIAVLMN